MKRLGIYVFYDENGIVDDYIPFFLDDFTQYFEEFLIVCNGKISEEGQKTFEKYTPNILVRENKGLDAGAYKDGLAYYGWKQLETYDEILLVNDTIMGPVYPFGEMFSEMEQRELDFWGMTRHYALKEDNTFKCKYGYTPEHIQSYFMAFRKKFVQTKHFQSYWEKMPYYEDYRQVVGRHEVVFTKHFEDLGYHWDTYVDTTEYREKHCSPNMTFPMELIRDKKCPIFKKRTFFQEYYWVINTSVGQYTVKLYNYLKEHTDYPENLILTCMIRSRHMIDLYRNFHWMYVLPKYQMKDNCKKDWSSDSKVGIIAFIHYPDMIETMCDYLLNLPSFVDVFIYTNSDEKAVQIKEACLSRSIRLKGMGVVPNRGRDMGCLLVEAPRFMFDYKYMGFVHDKKSTHIAIASIANGFFYKCMENMVASESYIYNVLDTFEKNEKLGILSPSEPNHAHFVYTIGAEWGADYSIAKELADELELTAPMSEQVMPLAPLGDYFWFRPEALRPLYRKKWSYDDFPQEPIGVDGTILHAIERIYPFAAQTAGYYSGHMLTDEFAALECMNLEYQLTNKTELAKETKELYLNSTCWKITAPLRWIMDLWKSSHNGGSKIKK